MDVGWIKLHRKSKKSAVMQNPVAWFVWCHLLMDANIEDRQLWDGKVVKRGEVVLGQSKYADEIGISRQQLRTALAGLERNGNINQQTNQRGTVVTICNYGGYQNTNEASNPLTNQQLTSDQPAANQQPTSSQPLRKEYQEDKEEKKGRRSASPPTDSKEVNEVLESWFDQLGLKHGYRDPIAEQRHAMDVKRHFDEHGERFVIDALDRTIRKRGNFVYWTERADSSKPQDSISIPEDF